MAYLHTGDIARALNRYSDAIKHDLEDYEMLSAMSNFWLTLGDLEQAEYWLQRAKAIGAGEPIPTWSRLMVYQYSEQHELAYELLGIKK